MNEDLERVLHGEPVAATPVLAPEQSTQVLTRPARDTAVLPVPAVDDERRRRRRIAAGVLIGILVLGALVAGLILLATSLIGSTPTVKVPDVRNRNVEAAKIILRQARLKFKVTEKPSSRLADTVIDQSPDPGTEVKEGTTVQLTVSAGPSRRRRPMRPPRCRQSTCSWGSACPASPATPSSRDGSCEPSPPRTPRSGPERPWTTCSPADRPPR